MTPAKKSIMDPKEKYIKGLEIVNQSVNTYTKRAGVIVYSKMVLEESYNIADHFIADCYSRIPKKYTARGLYMQKIPFEQSVLITCLKGCIVVYAVDLREDSLTFLRYNKFVIKNTNDSRKSIYIPRGVAYGYVSMEDDTEVFLKYDNHVAPEYEEVFNLADPNYHMRLQYPDLEGENRLIAELIAERKLTMSARDKAARWIWEYREELTQDAEAEKYLDKLQFHDNDDSDVILMEFADGDTLADTDPEKKKNQKHNSEE